MLTDSELILESEEGKIDMCQAIKEMREESYENGRHEGEKLASVRLLSELVRDGVLSLQEAASRAGMSVAEFEAEAGKLA